MKNAPSHETTKSLCCQVDRMLERYYHALESESCMDRWTGQYTVYSLSLNKHDCLECGGVKMEAGPWLTSRERLGTGIGPEDWSWSFLVTMIGPGHFWSWWLVHVSVPFISWSWYRYQSRSWFQSFRFVVLFFMMVPVPDPDPVLVPVPDQTWSRSLDPIPVSSYF